VTGTRAPRRPGFDDATQGWGLDTLTALARRIELVENICSIGPRPSFAENRVIDAMKGRLHTMQSEGVLWL